MHNFNKYRVSQFNEISSTDSTFYYELVNMCKTEYNQAFESKDKLDKGVEKKE